ncbi:MAG: cysteine desulfurase, partial [Thermoproteota archaeon]|nr:cysteine desulfurase [Thermoproteota archaeon]
MIQESTLDVFKIREDFPILKRKINGNKTLVYLDNAATTQKPIIVINAILDYY